MGFTAIHGVHSVTHTSFPLVSTFYKCSSILMSDWWLKGAAWSNRHLRWPCSVYGDTASAEVGIHTSCALRSSAELSRAVVKEVVKEVSLFLYKTFHPHLQFCQTIMSMQSYTEPSALLQHLRGARVCGTELNLASACLQRRRNCVTPSIQSLIFGSSLNWFIGLPTCTHAHTHTHKHTYIHTMHSKSIRTPWLFPHFATLQPYFKMD